MTWLGCKWKSLASKAEIPPSSPIIILFVIIIHVLMSDFIPVYLKYVFNFHPLLITEGLL